MDSKAITILRDGLLLAIGAVGGAAVVHFGPSPGMPIGVGDASGRSEAAEPVTAGEPRVAGLQGSTAAAERLAISERVAALTSAVALESEIELAAATPPSYRRDLELDVLLRRLAELDSRRAIVAVRALDLDARFVVPLYVMWAERDADAVLAELGTVTPPATRRAVALAVLEALGDTDSAVERVASGLPAIERPGFRLDALAARAADDPAGVFAAVMSGGSQLTQSVLLPQVAASAARADLEGALALASGIGDPQARMVSVAAVLKVWTEQDPAAVLAYLESSPPNTLRGAAETVQVLASVDPVRMLAIAERMPPDLRLGARSAALVAMAERDVSAALARLDSVPAGRDRDSLLRPIAATYARQNADAALAWAKSLSPPSQTAVSGVIEGIAAQSFDRALERVLLEIANGTTAGISFGQALPPGPLFAAINADPGNAPQLLNRLVASGDSALLSRAEGAAYVWSQRDPARAVDWVIANLEALGASSVTPLAQQIAGRDPALAAITPDRLPAEARALWIASAADAMAATDPNGAMAYLEPFRGEPGHAEAVTAVVRRAAPLNPAAAAGWAKEVGHPPALAAAATSWARNDAAAAERWVLDLPRGEGRDAALAGYFAGAVDDGDIDRTLLGAFDSDVTRQQAVARAALRIAVTDVEAARALTREHITDPELRRGVEEQLGRAGRMPPVQLPRFQGLTQ